MAWDLNQINQAFMAGLPNPAEAFDQGVDRNIALQGQRQALGLRDLQMRAGEQALIDAQAKMAREAELRASLSSLDPSNPRQVASMIARYPEVAQQLKSAFDVGDGAANKANLRSTAEIWSAAASGNTQLAAQLARKRYEADKAAGQADESDLAMVEALESDDPEVRRQALVPLAASLAATVGPDKFASVFQATSPLREGKVVDRFLVDPVTGEVRFEAPAPPEFRTVGEGQSIVQLEGGGPASGAAATGADIERVAASTVPGLTVTSRARSAEHNRAVGGVPNSRHLSDQARDFVPPAGMSMGDLASRLRAALPGAKVINEGDHVHVESTGRNGSGSRVVAQGPAKQQWEMMTPQEVASVPGLDPKLAYQRGPQGQIQPVGGAQGRTFKQIPGGTAEKAQKNVAVLDALNRAVSGFRDDFAGNAVTGDLENRIDAVFGTGTPGQRDWWADFRNTDNIIRNQLFGSALTEHEKKAYEGTTISPSMSGATIRKNLQRRRDIIQSALNRQAKFLKANKYDPDAVDALFQADALSGANIPQVRSIGEARKLPKGTVFIDPNGVRRVR